MSAERSLVDEPECASQDLLPLSLDADAPQDDDPSPAPPGLTRDNHAIFRRRRDVRAARDRLGEQFDQLRKVLPDPPPGVELSAKAQVLEHSLDVIQKLMKKASHLAMELAVVSPNATRRWVRTTCDEGRKPLLEAVGGVMKLFAARYNWRYAEWWTLDECQNFEAEGAASSPPAEGGDQNGQRDDVQEHGGMIDEKPEGVLDDPPNVHGCVVRDSISVMRLAWTLIHRPAEAQIVHTPKQEAEDEALATFARASSKFEFKPRVGMPGRVWTSRRAEWLINLRDRETFIRSPLAEKFGMKTCLAVPIQFGGHVHSVMAFYSKEMRNYNPEVYDLATLLSQALEEVYSPSNTGPWQMSADTLFRPNYGA